MWGACRCAFVVPATIIVGALAGCGRFGFDAVSRTGDDSVPGTDGSSPSEDAALPTVTLVKKTDAPDWTPLTGPGLGLPYGLLTWEPSGPTFSFRVDVSGLTPGNAYTLIQYNEPWPGAPATDLAAATVDGTGALSIPWSSYELGRDLTATNGRLWLVPTSFIDTNADVMVTWDVTAILFELDFVIYDDTDVP